MLKVTKKRLLLSIICISIILIGFLVIYTFEIKNANTPEGVIKEYFHAWDMKDAKKIQSLNYGPLTINLINENYFSCVKTIKIRKIQHLKLNPYLVDETNTFKKMFKIVDPNYSYEWYRVYYDVKITKSGPVDPGKQWHYYLMVRKNPKSQWKVGMSGY